MTTVLILTPNYPRPDKPQNGIFVQRQATRLMQAGVDCHVVTYGPAAPSFPRWLMKRTWLRYYASRLRPWRPDGPPVDEVRYRRRWTRDEDVVPAIVEALTAWAETSPVAQHVDVVYANWLWNAGAVALQLREQTGWPMAAIARGCEMHGWHAAQPHCRPYVERVLQGADRLLANCDYLRQQAERLAPGSAAAMEVVYNGCDAEYFRPADDRALVRCQFGLRETDKLFVFCGEVIPRKGIAELATAWRRFSSVHDDWRLHVVGQVSNRDLARQLRSAASDKVTFTGQLPPAKLLKHLQAADGYLQPSRGEGLANSTMEAMAVGLPVITTAVSGQPELIDNGINGLLTGPNDSEALSDAMCELAGDPRRAMRFGRAARETIVERFHPQRHAERLAAILTETARGKLPENERPPLGAAAPASSQPTLQ